MIYGAIVRMKIRQTFDHLNNHRWDRAVEALAPTVHHRVSGLHALAGERHDKKSVRKWFERLGHVLPDLHITLTDVTVKGWPWNTRVFAQWDSKATRIDAQPYINRGVHVFTLRWGRVYKLEEFQDSQAAALGLAAQSAGGLDEAGAKPIAS